jgi:hypothetical protein
MVAWPHSCGPMAIENIVARDGMAVDSCSPHCGQEGGREG